MSNKDLLYSTQNYSQNLAIIYNIKWSEKNYIYTGFLGGAGGKEHACQCKRHETQVPSLSLKDFPGGGHHNPLQYFCLENPMDRGAWRATLHRVAKSQT